MTTSTESADDRINGLSDRIGRLRRRASAGSLDRWLLVAGAVLIPLGIVLIVLGWANAVLALLRALEGEVRVQLHHGRARCDRLGAVHLDLVVVLRPRAGGAHHQQRSGDP